jgi:hypothetical protein
LLKSSIMIVTVILKIPDPDEHFER